MSELKHLVPPLELCREIPPGGFKDTALIWFFDGHSWWVNAREFDAQPEQEYPAPTLQDILDRLSEFGEPVTVTQWKTGQIAVSCQINDDVFEEVSQDGASAALKLWLELYNQ